MSAPRGRGRARGQTRGSASQAPQGPGIRQQQQPPPPRSAWGPPQGDVAAPGRGAIPKAPTVPVGRVSTRVEQPRTPGHVEGVVTGSGDGDMCRITGSLMRGKNRHPTDILVTRPSALESKKGSYGKQVTLSANYFKFSKTTNWTLYQYRVDFSHDEDRTNIRKRLMYTAMKDIVRVYLFDGTVFYTPNRLSQDPLELFVTMPGDESEKKIRITLHMVGELKEGDYHYLQVYNITLRKCIQALKLQLVGRNYYDAFAKVVLQDYKLELWPGYITSIRQHEQEILLCNEVAFKVMRNDTVLNLLTECLKEDKREYKRLFASRVTGAVVLTGYNNRTYRIDDVDWNSTPESQFAKADGSRVSYLKYYQEKYQIRIKQPDQPMLVSRAKAREIRAGMAETVMLVPELCRMTGLTDEQRSNMMLMRALANHTRLEPSARIDSLLKFNRRLLSNPVVVEELKKWDLNFAEKLIEFPGRILPPEKIVQGRNKKCDTYKDADWTRELRSFEMFNAATVNRWVIMYTRNKQTAVESFVGMMIRAAKGMRWNLPYPEKFELSDDRPVSYLQGLDTLLNNRKGEPDLVFCVVTSNKADRYSAIKKKCCVDKAVPSQVFVARNLECKGAMSIATKVVVQMNTKLGGAPWAVELPISGLMVIGFDVCHDTSNRTVSFGAMVASIDQSISKYFSTVSPHKSGEELSNDLAENIVKACEVYKQNNGKVPDRIAIYRDGVGDGQLPYVFEHEIGLIRKRLGETFYPNNSLRLAFIVVSKRINTRIFYGGRNPPPGTVVDDCITLPERHDFFIVSQCVKQGTVSPTSYNVISNNIGFTPDQLQRLSYKLTHLYYNWSGTVRVPAPCQYAHKLAFLVGQFLHRSPHQDLRSCLYYL